MPGTVGKIKYNLCTCLQKIIKFTSHNLNNFLIETYIWFTINCKKGGGETETG